MLEPNNSQAILLGGTSKSGKTRLRFMLDQHPLLASFAGMNLMTYEIFRFFPEWMTVQPRSMRKEFCAIYKQLCLTRLYCFRERIRGQRGDGLWWRIEKEWKHRFISPEGNFWRTFVGKQMESLWLSCPIQTRKLLSFGDATRAKGYCGLGFPDESGPGLNQSEISQYFNILNQMIDATSEKTMHQIYGKFWNSVFTQFASNRGKKMWVKESTINAANAQFWKKCFGRIKMIHVIRDGRDVAWARVLKYGGRPEDALDRWAKKVKKNMKAQNQMQSNEYLNIRYEDLALKQESTLRLVCDFLQIPFDSKMLSYSLHANEIGRFAHEAPKEFGIYAQKEHGELLRELNYRDMNAYVN